MDTYQEIAELGAELKFTRLSKIERQATVRRLHELQRQLEIAEDEATDASDRATAERLYDQWLGIETTIAA